jgi:hypothetical protein
MPKLGCPCGFVHDLSPIPDDGWVTVRDRDYEALVKVEVAMHAGNREGICQSVELTGRLYECPKCGRVMWQRSGEERFAVFHPEPDA